MAIRWFPRILAGATLVLILPVAFAQQRGSCILVESPADVRLPDGTLAARGTLRLCVERNLSPVTVIHTISANGVRLGLYSARTERSEGAGLLRPLVAFTSRGDGTLALSGYAEGAGRTVTCRFAAAPPPDDRPVWIAGRVDWPDSSRGTRRN